LQAEVLLSLPSRQASGQQTGLQPLLLLAGFAGYPTIAPVRIQVYH